MMKRIINWLCGRHLMDDDMSEVILQKLAGRYDQ